MTTAEEKIKQRTKQETLLYVLSEYRKTHKMVNTTEIILNSLRRKAMLEDIAILTGGTVISEEKGYKLENVEIEHLGTAEKITVDKDNTTIVNGGGDETQITARINQINPRIDGGVNHFNRLIFRSRVSEIVCAQG